MKTFALSALFGLALTSPAAAQDIPPKLGNALLVEWVVANCDFPDSFGLAVMVASMVINGSDPAEVARVRPLVRAHALNTPNNTTDRCKELIAGLS